MAKRAKPERSPAYFVIEARNPKRMLLESLPTPSFRYSWLLGKSWKPSTLPVVVRIVKGYEKAERLPFFGTPPVITNEFHAALVRAGVDNLDAFDAVLEGEDRKTRYEGFKAVNILGLVSAADLKKTAFAPDNESRLIDASIDSLAIDRAKAKGLLMFRLAEYTGAVIVHQQIRRAIEDAGFPHVVFTDPGGYLSP